MSSADFLLLTVNLFDCKMSISLALSFLSALVGPRVSITRRLGVKLGSM